MRVAWVLQQALQDKLESELPLPVDETILQPLQSDIRELKERTAIMREQYKAEDFGAVSVDNFPPCMKHFIGMAQAGENLPHSARFALVSFLHHIGLSSDEILNLFAVSPDFDASKTRYQIDHITGESSGVEYTPPECTTMKSYGNCVEPDSLCNNPKTKVKHPLTYYRIKNRPMKAPKGTIFQILSALWTAVMFPTRANHIITSSNADRDTGPRSTRPSEKSMKTICSRGAMVSNTTRSARPSSPEYRRPAPMAWHCVPM